MPIFNPEKALPWREQCIGYSRCVLLSHHVDGDDGDVFTRNVVRRHEAGSLSRPRRYATAAVQKKNTNN